MELLDKLKNLLVMAVVDGSLTEREIKFLSDRCELWDLSEGEFTAAIEYALSDKARIQLPEEKGERVELLQDLIRMMAADGKLTDVEKRLFASAAARMAISEDELNRIIDSVL